MRTSALGYAAVLTGYGSSNSDSNADNARTTLDSVHREFREFAASLDVQDGSGTFVTELQNRCLAAPELVDATDASLACRWYLAAPQS